MWADRKRTLCYVSENVLFLSFPDICFKQHRALPLHPVTEALFSLQCRIWILNSFFFTDTFPASGNTALFFLFPQFKLIQKDEDGR